MQQVIEMLYERYWGPDDENRKKLHVTLVLRNAEDIASAGWRYFATMTGSVLCSLIVDVRRRTAASNAVVQSGPPANVWSVDDDGPVRLVRSACSERSNPCRVELWHSAPDGGEWRVVLDHLGGPGERRVRRWTIDPRIDRLLCRFPPSSLLSPQQVDPADFP